MFSTPLRSLLQAFLLLAGLALSTLAFSAPYPQIVPSVPDIDVYNTIGMIPIVPVAEQLGVTFKSEKANGSTTVTAGEHSMVFTPKSNNATCDGTEITLRMAPFQTASGLLYVPVQAFIEGLGGTLTINAGKKLCLLNLPTRKTPFAMPYVYQKNLPDATTDVDNELYAMNIDGSKLRRLTFDSADNGLPVLVPNSTTFYYSRNGAIVQRAANDAAETPLPQPKDGVPQVPYFPCGISADGKSLLYQQCVVGVQHNQIYLQQAGANEPSTITRDGCAPSLSPDGKTIACLHQQDGKTSLYLISADDGSRQCIEERAGGMTPSLFSPDGALLAYKREVSQVANKSRSMTVVYQVSGEHAGKSSDIPVSELKGNELTAVFSPDSKWLLINSIDSGLQIMRPDRTEARKLVGYFVTQPTFTPDGAQILFAAGNSLHCINRDGSNDRVLLQNILIYDLLLTPDGKQILLLAKPADTRQNITSGEKW